MEQNLINIVKPIILAFVGMPGAGKSEAASYLKERGIPFVRFGQITDDEVKRRGLSLTPENEKAVREDIRENHGMAAYAILSRPRIDELLKENHIIAIDGLYSWEEYLYLSKEFPGLTIVNVYAESLKRYERLADRGVRHMTFKEARERDIAELEKLNKGAPIAIADYMVENNSDLDDMYKKIDTLLTRLHIAL